MIKQDGCGGGGESGESGLVDSSDPQQTVLKGREERKQNRSLCSVDRENHNTAEEGREMERHWIVARAEKGIPGGTGVKRTDHRYA